MQCAINSSKIRNVLTFINIYVKIRNVLAFNNMSDNKSVDINEQYLCKVTKICNNNFIVSNNMRNLETCSVVV